MVGLELHPVCSFIYQLNNMTQQELNKLGNVVLRITEIELADLLGWSEVQRQTILAKDQSVIVIPRTVHSSRGYIECGVFYRRHDLSSDSLTIHIAIVRIKDLLKEPAPMAVWFKRGNNNAFRRSL